MSSIARYISILKSNGLAVNNLYDIEISLPSGTLKTMLEAGLKYNKLSQIDVTRRGIENNSLLDDFSVDNLSTGVSKKFTPQINSISDLS